MKIKIKHGEVIGETFTKHRHMVAELQRAAIKTAGAVKRVSKALGHKYYPRKIKDDE